MVKNPSANSGDIRARVRSLAWEDPLEEGMQPTPIFLPGESHGQRSLVGYSPWGRKEWTQQSELSNNILNSKQFTVPLFSQMFRLVAVGVRSQSSLFYSLVNFLY